MGFPNHPASFSDFNATADKAWGIGLDGAKKKDRVPWDAVDGTDDAEGIPPLAGGERVVLEFKFDFVGAARFDVQRLGLGHWGTIDGDRD